MLHDGAPAFSETIENSRWASRGQPLAAGILTEEGRTGSDSEDGTG